MEGQVTKVRKVTSVDELVGLNLAHAEQVICAGLQARNRRFQSLILFRIGSQLVEVPIARKLRLVFFVWSDFPCG